MSKRSSVPKYRLHKKSGQAIVTLTDPSGRRRDVLLGPYNSPQSRTAYARAILQWETAGRRLPAADAPDCSLNELMAQYVSWCKEYYKRPDGSPSSELQNIKDALRWVKNLYGHIPLHEFGPLALETVRRAMIGAGTCRSSINKDISRIRRLFRWAVAKELAPANLWERLRAVEGLRAGRSAAKEMPPVRPVPLAVVEATLPILPEVLADMAQLQLLTGCRPGEVCNLRACDLDTTGPVWIYTPPQHKNAFRGHKRQIAIGPRGQEIVKKYLTLSTQEFLFSPKASIEKFRQKQRQERKTPVQPSQQNRKKPKPKRKPRNKYDPTSYAGNLRRAIERYNAGRPPSEQLPYWCPNQLRHTKATELRKKYGIDAARAVLGHRSPAITETYAELDTNKAMEIMAKLG